jgi:putative peptidoglycan lipid II flippase
MRVIFFATVPLSLLIPVLAEPTVRLLFQWGRFTAADAHATAQATALYALAIFAHSGSGIATRAFYALQWTAPTVAMGLASTAVYVALNMALMGPMGANGLALSMSVAAVVNLMGLLLLLRRRLGASGLGYAFLRALLASAPAAGAAWMAAGVIGGSGAALTPALALARLVVGGGIGGAVYVALAWRLGIEEVGLIARVVDRFRPGRTRRVAATIEACGASVGSAGASPSQGSR